MENTIQRTQIDEMIHLWIMGKFENNNNKIKNGETKFKKQSIKQNIHNIHHDHHPRTQN